VPPVRLQKLIAGAGIASRRAAERLIAEGRVSVNGATVTGMGATADPAVDDVRVDGAPLTPPAARTYLLLHKPHGYVTTARDPHATRTVMDLLPPGTARVFPAGRLDRESEGLLLLTDDGALTERLLHPRYGLEREYAVLVRGDLTPATLARLRAGTEVEGAHVTPLRVAAEAPPAPLSGHALPGTHWLRVTLREGRRREVRVLCAAARLDVLRLIRVRFGPLHLGDLPPGQVRALTEVELAALRAAAGGTASPPQRAEAPGGPPRTGTKAVAAVSRRRRRPASRTTATPARRSGTPGRGR
jgi:23S rRNA pseudouridine2605 synthase